MDTMSIAEANLRPRPSLPALPRPAHAATVVAALYVLMVLGAPWIVRYAPSHEVQVVEQLAERPPLLRCASAPEFGLPCGSGITLPGANPGRSA